MNTHGKPLMHYRTDQGGAALVVGMILLLVLTLVGLTSMRTTRLETAMAGNAAEMNISFQAAEAGLRDAEAFVEGTVALTAFNGDDGLLGQDDAEPNYLNMNWMATNPAVSQPYSSSVPDVYQQPRFVVKHVGDVTNQNAQNTAIAITGYGTGINNPTVSIFRVTSRATGRNDSAVTVLQSHYGKIY